jgi:hypothetical protein
VNQQELVRDSKALLEEVAVREWFIIYSTAYHIAIFTDIMDNSYFISILQNRCSVILVLFQRVGGARIKLFRYHQQLSIICTATAHCTVLRTIHI